jgi:dolichol-phosphate mannosyltransferase
MHRIHVRRRHEGSGLSSAVVLGFTKAKYGTLLCMDADLQHEPESVPAVAEPILNGDADFSVGSRAAEGAGELDNWAIHRRVISWFATLLARPLTASSDPMSGFFCLSKDTFQRGESKLNPIGYKIGLELMVRCGCKNVQEVPIQFRDREAGESKLSMKQNVLYVQQLVALYWFKFWIAIVLCLALCLYFVSTLV